MFDFTDKVFVVTGAAGSLGQAVAKALREAGAKLAVLGRANEERFNEVFPEYVGSDDWYFGYETDLTDPDAVARAIEHIMLTFGRIDGLMNVVGGFRAGTPVHETPIETWDFMFDVNVRTTVLTSRAVVPHMIRQGRGTIVNVGSRHALTGGINSAAYSASKAAVVRLTESMSAEVKAHGINVNCVLPGTIDTPANRDAMPNADFSRWVPPSELTHVILFLSSDYARAVHGAAIPVYGLG